MWALENQTSYAAERNWVRDKHGRHHWVVAVKATFDVSAAGALRLADEQTPPALAPEYAGEPGKSSLRWDSDVLYVKPATDVIAEAQAHAPGGKARASVEVSLRVGPIHKRLLVHGARAYYRGVSGLTTTAPTPFQVQPISYEWAFGGADLSDADASKHRIYDPNPIGKGFALQPGRLVNQVAPAIEYPGKDVAKAGPASFGPIDAAWSPRREHAGTYDGAWEQKKKPLLPDDYHELYGSCAPADQRVSEHLRGGEPVELSNLTPEGVLRLVLPKIYLTYESHFGSRREEHRGRLVTVLLLPEKKQLALIWQSSLYVAPRDTDYLDHTVIAEKPYLS